MNDELTQNVTGWLHTLLSTPGAVQIDAAQADHVVQAKSWLAKVNTGKLVVSAPEHEKPEED